MNIFVTDIDPAKAAIHLDDKRVVKMVLETAQMLSTCMTHLGLDAPYKPTHMNHPCTIWVRTNQNNYAWTIRYFGALLREYTHRYRKVHKCQQYMKQFAVVWDQFPEAIRTSFAPCHGQTDAIDVYAGYRECLRLKWQNDEREPHWTNRKQPKWAQV